MFAWTSSILILKNDYLILLCWLLKVLETGWVSILVATVWSRPTTCKSLIDFLTQLLYLLLYISCFAQHLLRRHGLQLLSITQAWSWHLILMNLEIPVESLSAIQWTVIVILSDLYKFFFLECKFSIVDWEVIWNDDVLVKLLSLLVGFLVRIWLWLGNVSFNWFRFGLVGSSVFHCCKLRWWGQQEVRLSFNEVVLPPLIKPLSKLILIYHILLHILDSICSNDQFYACKCFSQQVLSQSIICFHFKFM